MTDAPVTTSRDASELVWNDAWPSKDLAHQSLCLAANSDPGEGPLSLLERMEFLHLLRAKVEAEIVRRTRAEIRDRVLELSPDCAGALLVVPVGGSNGQWYAYGRYAYGLKRARVSREDAGSTAAPAPVRGDSLLHTLVATITDIHQPDLDTEDLVIQL